MWVVVLVWFLLIFKGNFYVKMDVLKRVELVKEFFKIMYNKIYENDFIGF